VGTQWTLVSIGDDAAVATDDGTVPSLQFDTATAASGSDACNLMQSGYTLTDDSLAFAGWTSTKKACTSPETVAQQGHYTQALAATASYHLSGDRLDLLDASGKVVLSFTRALIER